MTNFPPIGSPSPRPATRVGEELGKYESRTHSYETCKEAFAALLRGELPFLSGFMPAFYALVLRKEKMYAFFDEKGPENAKLWLGKFFSFALSGNQAAMDELSTKGLQDKVREGGLECLMEAIADKTYGTALCESIELVIQDLGAPSVAAMFTAVFPSVTLGIRGGTGTDSATAIELLLARGDRNLKMLALSITHMLAKANAPRPIPIDLVASDRRMERFRGRSEANATAGIVEESVREGQAAFMAFDFICGRLPAAETVAGNPDEFAESIVLLKDAKIDPSDLIVGLPEGMGWLNIVFDWSDDKKIVQYGADDVDPETPPERSIRMRGANDPATIALAELAFKSRVYDGFDSVECLISDFCTGNRCAIGHPIEETFCTAKKQLEALREARAITIGITGITIHGQQYALKGIGAQSFSPLQVAQLPNVSRITLAKPFDVATMRLLSESIARQGRELTIELELGSVPHFSTEEQLNKWLGDIRKLGEISKQSGGKVRFQFRKDGISICDTSLGRGQILEPLYTKLEAELPEMQPGHDANAAEHVIIDGVKYAVRRNYGYGISSVRIGAFEDVDDGSPADLSAFDVVD
ncbi:MAG: hypothetical protein LBB38_02810 [Puniceicoccales bacterium]|jgi:hypothetical protein|nr:hypothetical protein [Puniceicoccales bacterium]